MGGLRGLRTLRRRADRLTARQVLHSLARLWFRGFFYHRALGGRRPRNLEINIQEMWPGDADRGTAIIGGDFTFAGETRQAAEALWRPKDASPEWLAELHGFGWLADLRAVGGAAGRDSARELVARWIETESGWRAGPWRADVAATRLVNWMTHADFLFTGAQGTFGQLWLDSVARHARHLRHVVVLLDPGVERLTVLKALVYAGLGLALERRRLDKWIAALLPEIEAQIVTDGGHISRSPKVQFAVFRDLTEAIDRMAPMVRFFRHGDGGFGLFNGANEGENWLIDVVLSRAEARGKAVDEATQTGFQRLAANRTLVIVDAGPPPAPAFDAHAHAGALSFEMSVGKQRMIVNCGAYGGPRSDWKLAQRLTAAHSTIGIDDLSSSEILPGPLIGARPHSVTVRRNESAGNIWIDARLDGFAGDRALTHRRRLYLSANGSDLRGEDTLTGGAGHKFVARFHLHPSVRASLVQDGESVLLRLGDRGGWRFRASGGATSLQESVYLGEGGRTRRGEQIVVSGATQPDNAQIKWAFTRLADD